MFLKKKWIIAISKNTFGALDIIPGSKGNRSQATEHRQKSISVVGDLAPSCDAVRHKCSEMHSGRALKFSEAGSWITFMF